VLYIFNYTHIHTQNYIFLLTLSRTNINFNITRQIGKRINK